MEEEKEEIEFNGGSGHSGGSFGGELDRSSSYVVPLKDSEPSDSFANPSSNNSMGGDSSMNSNSPNNSNHDSLGGGFLQEFPLHRMLPPGVTDMDEAESRGSRSSRGGSSVDRSATMPSPMLRRQLSSGNVSFASAESSGTNQNQSLASSQHQSSTNHSLTDHLSLPPTQQQQQQEQQQLQNYYYEGPSKENQIYQSYDNNSLNTTDHQQYYEPANTTINTTTTSFTRDETPMVKQYQPEQAHTQSYPTEPHQRLQRYASQAPGDDEGVDGAEFSDDYDDHIDPIVIFGIKLPMWLSRLILQPPSCSRISTLVVTLAPCFWFCGNQVQGNRAVLTRLNMLCSFFSSFQVVGSLWLMTLLLIVDDEPGALDDFSPHFWNINGAAFTIGLFGFIITLTCFFTIRVIQDVDLVGAIRYLWVVLWIIPFEIFFNISLFDYHKVTGVWIKYWWRRRTMSWFRGRFCRDGTAYTLCMVPIGGGPDYESEETWCMDKYNSDECSDIRDDAQKNAEMTLLSFYSSLAVWGLILLFLLLLMVNALERIISKPIVQKSRESNVPAWLTLPTTGSALVGAVYLYSPSSVLSSTTGSQSSWIGIVYLVSAGLFLIAALMGWFLSAFSIRNSGDKKNKNIAVIIFIGVMAANTVMLATIFVASIIFSADLVDAPIDDKARGEIACIVDQGTSCTLCEETLARDRCPEWKLGDVTKILQTQLKQSATLAAIFILYAISVLRFGIGLRKHLAMYQIDYV